MTEQELTMRTGLTFMLSLSTFLLVVYALWRGMRAIDEIKALLLASAGQRPFFKTADPPANVVKNP